ncbi:MAG: GntR family transcriptional regulator [Sphaerochaetaceae bacterium]|nr:GntR family transcriptional regulator [Spirochaetales bacterium]MDY5499891.1 GntR family transcriptional regulator [Sphaerochaetaceae bacterium]
MTVTFETVPLNQQVANELRTAIMRGDIKDGQRLQLAELEATFHISRTPIKEGLMMLEHEGFVQHERNKDFIVIGMSEEYINDYYDLRKVFEAAAIKNACKHKEDLSAILSLQNSIEGTSIKTLTVDLFKDYSAKFHSELWKLSGNTRIIGFLNFLFEGPGVEMFENPFKHWEKTIKEHRAVLDAIQQGNSAKAVELNNAHQERCRSRLLKAWKDKQARENQEEVMHGQA